MRSLGLLFVAALAAMWAGCDPSDARVPALDQDTSRTGGEADAAFVPYIRGDWTRVYAPGGTRYLNDHCLVRGPDGTWHLYGITDTSPGDPHAERALLHATAPSLFGRWREHDDILTSESAVDEGPLWAPFAFESSPGRWTMYYASSPSQPSDRVLRRADSTDLSRWTRAEQVPAPTLRPPGGRDPFLLRVGETWFLYSVGVDAGSHGQIVLSTSDDLQRWTDPVAVVTDPVPSFGWGNLESPFVVPYRGHYYLFLTRTADTHADYVRTTVLRSRDPARFDWEPITDLRAHAAEVIYDAQLGYLLTSAGWTFEVGEPNRGLSVARLGWAPE